MYWVRQDNFEDSGRGPRQQFYYLLDFGSVRPLSGLHVEVIVLQNSSV